MTFLKKDSYEPFEQFVREEFHFLVEKYGFNDPAIREWRLYEVYFRQDQLEVRVFVDVGLQKEFEETASVIITEAPGEHVAPEDFNWLVDYMHAAGEYDQSKPPSLQTQAAFLKRRWHDIKDGSLLPEKVPVPEEVLNLTAPSRLPLVGILMLVIGMWVMLFINDPSWPASAGSVLVLGFIVILSVSLFLMSRKS